ncbi:MAG: hypothetical protein HDR82_04630 [Bacteroides sp.]|nr:hypothetical protein [Bacteroides sp.]
MTEYNDEFWKWVSDHRKIDPYKLRLNYRADTPWINDAIAQIENERRAKNKFGNVAESHLLPTLYPIGLSIEQSTTPRIAMLHRQLAHITPGSPFRILEMTCGLGIDASFLASDAATKLTAIELNSQIASVAEYNFKARENINIINGNSIDYLTNSNEHFNLIFIDPARRDDSGGRVYNLHDCTPDVTQLLPLMASKSDVIMIKMSPMLDVTQTLRDLPQTTELYVVGERGECRELLAIIDTHRQVATPIITVWSDGSTFSFTQPEEAEAEASVSMPRQGEFLLEPSAAMMKAAPFKLISQRYKASMIHPNTHVYTADYRPEDFAGKVYQIDEMLPYSSSNIKRIKKMKLNCDVAVRNFNIGADELRSRLGINKSGEKRLLGITAADSKPYILFLSPA